MTTRTRRKLLTFAQPFFLRTIDAVMPAGTYKIDVDEDLYGGFVGNEDRRTLQRLRGLSPQALADKRPAFADPRLDVMVVEKYVGDQWRDQYQRGILGPPPGAVLAVVLTVLLSQGLAIFFTRITNYNALYGSLGAILAVPMEHHHNPDAATEPHLRRTARVVALATPNETADTGLIQIVPETAPDVAVKAFASGLPAQTGSTTSGPPSSSSVVKL